MNRNCCHNSDNVIDRATTALPFINTPVQRTSQVASMVKSVGEPFTKLFLIGYTIPTLHIHATLASAYQDESRHETPEKRQVHDAEVALMCAMMFFLAVIRSQNELFRLGLARGLPDRSAIPAYEVMMHGNCRTQRPEVQRKRVIVKRLTEPGLTHWRNSETVDRSTAAFASRHDEAARGSNSH